MKILINAPKVIQLPPSEFKRCARGLVNTVSNKTLKTGDRLIIKEHTGKRYTGGEITAEVTKSANGEVTIRKNSITYDETLKKQNKRDVGRKTNKKNKFNAYI